MPTYGKNDSTLNLEHLQLKFAAASSWQASTVLLAGEVGVESDTHKFKVGDGTTTWENLPYSADPTLAGLISALTTRVDTAEGNITSLGTRLTTAESDIDTAEADIDALEGRMDTAEGNITSQGTRLTTAEGDIDALETRATNIESKNTEQDGRLTALEGITCISANPFSA